MDFAVVLVLALLAESERADKAERLVNSLSIDVKNLLIEQAKTQRKSKRTMFDPPESKSN